MTFESINYEFTKHIVNLTKKANIKKIIYLSGLGVSPKINSGYFISKFKAEEEIEIQDLDYTIFRPSYIVGKDDLFTKYLKKQIKKRKIEIPGSGKFQIQPITLMMLVQINFSSILDSKKI